jgi:hypothetical protein
MYGNDIGGLNVYQFWNKTKKQLVWTKNSSTKDDAWKTAWIDFRTSQKFYVSKIGNEGHFY